MPPARPSFSLIPASSGVRPWARARPSCAHDQQNGQAVFRQLREAPNTIRTRLRRGLASPSVFQDPRFARGLLAPALKGPGRIARGVSPGTIDHALVESPVRAVQIPAPPFQGSVLACCASSQGLHALGSPAAPLQGAYPSRFGPGLLAVPRACALGSPARPCRAHLSSFETASPRRTSARFGEVSPLLPDGLPTNG